MPEGFNSNKDSLFGRTAELNVTPLEYYKFVAEFNLLLQRELSEKLAENKEALGSQFTLVTLGSDARLEKGSFMSPLEVIAITDESLDLDLYREKLTEIINEVSPTAIAEIIEMKGPESSLVTAYNKSYQPGRIADSRLIYGKQSVVEDNKRKLGEEIIGLPANKVHNIGDLKRNARKVTEHGKNTFGGLEAIHFDLESGTVFYNPEAHQLSFKVGPLRLVQNTLLIEEVKHVRREKDANFFANLESNIGYRLDQLSDDKMVNLTRQYMEEIKEHYAFFLRLYHRSERAYEHDKKVAVQLSPSEAAEVATRLKALSALMENFKIGK